MNDSEWCIETTSSKGILVTKLLLKLVGFDMSRGKRRDYSTNGFFMK
jgi:hypothetical protein